MQANPLYFHGGINNLDITHRRQLSFYVVSGCQKDGIYSFRAICYFVSVAPGYIALDKTFILHNE